MAAQLGSLVLQAEVGNFDAAKHGVDYVDSFRVVPNQTEELSTAMMQLHSTCSGQSTTLAEMLFLNKVKWVVDYGIDRHKVVGDGNVSYHLGLVPTGILGRFLSNSILDGILACFTEASSLLYIFSRQ